MPLTITWYDNAAFRVATGEHIFWFDPSVNKNSSSPVRTGDIGEKADFVFTTHGDPGHFVNSVEMTKRTGAGFVGSEDLCRFVLANEQLPPDRVIAVKFEETKYLAGLEVYLFEAVHPELPPRLLQIMDRWGTVPTRNGGFVVKGADYCLCLLGDCIHSEKFQEIGRRWDIDVGMIPVQGKKHVDSTPEEAAESGARIARDLRLKVLFPVIQYPSEVARIEPLKRRLREMGVPTKVLMDKPGTVHRLKTW
jgi:L-ascorbate metabolism protein UlaG (beta-lactamase superfamily)